MDIGFAAWLAIALIILPLALLTWGMVSVDRNAFTLVQKNLQRGLEQPGQQVSKGDQEFAAIARRLTPGSYAAKLDKLLAMAGRPAAWPLDRVLVMKPLAALGGFGIGLLVVLAGGITARSVLLGLFLLAFGYFLPDLLVYNAGIKRQEEIQLELPNVLDQLLISVEAGLGFESAMARVATNATGPLADEMSRTLQDMQVGRSRREAYLALADRSTVPDLKSFVRAVVQADQYGIGIARVLKSQAGQMRVKRRQRAEERAMKLPVKILFPLLLFIFPTLFIVILGPAVINIMESGMFG